VGTGSGPAPAPEMTGPTPGPSPVSGERSVRPGLAEERRLWRAGHRWVAGLDEVGRGAWAGPVSVGVAVVCPGSRRRSMPTWLRDSKLLGEVRRESVFDTVAAWCADGAVGHASAAECDRWGMTAALCLAAHRALAALELRPDALLVDGPYDLLSPSTLCVDGDGDGGEHPVRSDRSPDPLPLPAVERPPTVVPVVGGDGRCASVAAASVLAKVVRDRHMREEAVHFPAYHFERNKGYPSPLHQVALRGYGLSAIHRRTWSFVADLPWHAGPDAPSSSATPQA
jgi:ribonuclease HII